MIEIQKKINEITKAQADVVAMLEHALMLARSGHIIAAAVATVERDNSAGTTYVTGKNAARLHYACASLTHRVLMHEEEP